MPAPGALRYGIVKWLDDVARNQSDRESIDLPKKLYRDDEAGSRRARWRRLMIASSQRLWRRDREAGPEIPRPGATYAPVFWLSKGPGRHHHGLNDLGGHANQTHDDAVTGFHPGAGIPGPPTWRASSIGVELAGFAPPLRRTRESVGARED